jgi:hypothetical protein
VDSRSRFLTPAGEGSRNNRICSRKIDSCRLVNLQALDLEDQCRTARDLGASAGISISKRRRDCQAALLANTHTVEALVPSLNDLTSTERKLKRISAVQRRVELFPSAFQGSRVVHLSRERGGEWLREESRGGRDWQKTTRRESNAHLQLVSLLRLDRAVLRAREHTNANSVLGGNHGEAQGCQQEKTHNETRHVGHTMQTRSSKRFASPTRREESQRRKRKKKKRSKEKERTAKAKEEFEERKEWGAKKTKGRETREESKRENLFLAGSPTCAGSWRVLVRGNRRRHDTEQRKGCLFL